MKLKESMGKKWLLLCGDIVVTPGMVVFSGRGEHYRVADGIGAPPHKPSSSGKIWVKSEDGGMSREFYPSVVGCRWEEVD